MTLNEYQLQAIRSAVYPGQGGLDGVVYCALKLNGEAGEVAEKIGKILRDHAGVINAARKLEILLELGDVLWYLASLSNELECSLQDVAELNMRKLAARRDRGTLQGSGDNR